LDATLPAGGASRRKGNGDARIAQGARTDEVLRGLGRSASGEAPPPADVQREGEGGEGAEGHRETGYGVVEDPTQARHEAER